MQQTASPSSPAAIISSGNSCTLNCFKTENKNQFCSPSYTWSKFSQSRFIGSSEWTSLDSIVQGVRVIWCVKSSDKTFFTKTLVCLWIFLSSPLNNPSPQISVSHLLLLPIVLLRQISSMKLMNLREFGNQNLLLSPPTEKGKEIGVVWDFQVLKLVNLYKTYWLKT